jgi:hypothetical protein
MIYVGIVVSFIFLVLIINQFIKDPNLRIAYWLLCFLFFVTLSNIYLSINFFKRIRNEPGKQGPDGNMGDQGMKGSNGVCKLSTKCGISNCRNVIEEELMVIFPIYKKIKSKLKRDIVLSSEEQKSHKQINAYIDILLPICEGGKLNKEEFIDHIHKSVK